MLSQCHYAECHSAFIKSTLPRGTHLKCGSGTSGVVPAGSQLRLPEELAERRLRRVVVVAVAAAFPVVALRVVAEAAAGQAEEAERHESELCRTHHAV